jgi:uncharacterized SAM-binding protein YcdF (DUF218 family)
MTGGCEPAIVLLGAMLLADGRPGPALMRRTDHAARLWAEGRAGVILATGGPEGADLTEAEAMRRRLRDQGVPESAILLEPRARDTYQNALFSIPLLRAEGLGRAILVSDRYHLPRALMLFRLMGCPAVASSPVSTAPRRDRLVRAGWETLAIPRDFGRGLRARLGSRLRD